MNEHSFIKSIHRFLPSELYRWKIHDTYTSGVPDSFYAGPAGILFVEYKYIKKLPVKDTTQLKTTLSPLQIQWLNRMDGFGQQTAVIVGCEDTAVTLTSGDWNSPLFKCDYVQRAVTRKDIANWISSACL